MQTKELLLASAKSLAPHRAHSAHLVCAFAHCCPGSTVGPLLVGRHPWVSAQKSSTVGPRDQFSLLRAVGNQTKLSTIDTVAFRVRRRPDRFHALRRAPPLHSPCQKFGNTDYFLKIPAKAKMRCSMKHGRQPSNQLRGAQDAAAHACSTGLSTGHHLMPMKALCGAASQCRGATTVRQLQTRGELWEAAGCVEHTERVQLHWHAKIVAIQTEARAAVQSTQPADALHELCTIHTVSN